MTQTTSVERFLGLVKLTELKCRAHKLNVVRLGDAIKIAVQDLAGRRLAGQVLDPVKLLVAKDSGGIWRASPYCIRAQNIYREFFGERALHCRSCEVKATTKDPPGIPPLGKVKQPKVSSRAFAQRLAAHSDAVGACARLQAPHRLLMLVVFACRLTKCVRAQSPGNLVHSCAVACSVHSWAVAWAVRFARTLPQMLITVPGPLCRALARDETRHFRSG